MTDLVAQIRASLPIGWEKNAWTEHELLLADAIAEIERLRAAADGARVGAGWQPIETAPKDGTPVLIAWSGTRFEAAKAHYEYGKWGGLSPTFGFDPFDRAPTHWMPLPDTSSLVGARDGAGERQATAPA
jgi:hypothetical protein